MAKIYVVTLIRAYEGMSNMFVHENKAVARNWLNTHCDDYAEFMTWEDGKLIKRENYKWVNKGWDFRNEDVNHYGE